MFEIDPAGNVGVQWNNGQAYYGKTAKPLSLIIAADSADFKVGDKVQNLIGTHGGIITRVGNNVIYYKCTWGNASEVGRELWMTKVEAKHTYQDGKIVSRDSAQDSDEKELRIGDKIKVQTDMHGRWDGGGVITALKPYGIVEYKDVFGHINTTQVNSVRRL